MNNKSDSAPVRMGPAFGFVCAVILVHALAACQVKPAAEPDGTQRDAKAPSRPAMAAAVEETRFLRGGSGPFSLGQLKGRPVILAVHAVGSPFLSAGFRELDQLQQDYSSRGLAVVGVLAAFRKGEDPEAVASGLGSTIPVVSSSSDLLKSLGGIRALPTLVLVDSKGAVRKQYPGLLQLADIQMDVEALLAER